MRETLWVVRDPSGKVIGASAQSEFAAIKEAERTLPTFTLQHLVHLVNEAHGHGMGITKTTATNGYTLTREALAALDAGVRVLDEYTVERIAKLDYEATVIGAKWEEAYEPLREQIREKMRGILALLDPDATSSNTAALSRINTTTPEDPTDA